MLYSVAYGPADDTPRKQVKNNSRIGPSFARPDIGDVAGPLLVWSARRKVLMQKIRCDSEEVIAVGGSLERKRCVAPTFCLMM